MLRVRKLQESLKLAGWFRRFKETSHPHTIKVQNEAPSTDIEAGSSYLEDLAKLIN